MPVPEPLHHLLARSRDPDNPSAERLLEVLGEVRTIAVVGLSRDPTKAARRVPSYLVTRGYDVIPVNPHADRIFGRAAVAHLDDVAEPVDLVLVFRPSAEAGAVVESAMRRPERPVIWLQEGITADPEAAAARAAGFTVVQDLCIFKAHRAAEGELPAPEGAPG